ncbi:MAG: TRAP transporter substrate-binding protein [Oscillospiraceae bacterium]|nr:TRAP transporter substrate-binding protein [Oscillospiraceae bacterium]
MKKLIAILLAAVMVFALAACGSPAPAATEPPAATEAAASAAVSPEIIIKLADVQAENDVETQFEYEFAELVAEKSNGRIEVQVFPAGQMGEMADILTSVQTGSIQMTRTNPSWLADAGVGSINILSLPFIFKDLDSANKVLESDVGKQMLQEIEDKDTQVKGLGYLEPSGRYFFFKNKEVSSLADIKNLKIRVQTNSLATSMVEHLGASATPISYNELYSSLQTGIVDGADNPLKGILNMSFFEVGKYVLDLAHQYEASIIIINEEFWKGLSADDQAILQAAMDEGAAYYKEIADAQLETYRTSLEEKGMVFVTPDDPQEWIDAVTPMYPEFTAGYEDILQAVIDVQK